MSRSFENDILIIGSGLGSLTAAALLAHDGQRVTVLEHNHLPGGCASSFYRQGYWFESGATTLVGLDAGMPLRHVLDVTGITFPVQKLELPMQVILQDGTTVKRFQDLEQWIREAERAFGKPGQRAFWEFCYELSDFVWQTSLRYPAFPPSNAADILDSARRLRPGEVLRARHAFRTVRDLLQQFDLLPNERFVRFIDEQLLITAQNTNAEVNVLFGAAALCYTNYNNYYVPGGMLRMIRAFCDYIENKGGRVLCRRTVASIRRERKNSGPFTVRTMKGETFTAPRLISGVPIHNTIELFANGAHSHIARRYAPRALPANRLWSAFSMGIVFQNDGTPPPTLHSQLHLNRNLPGIGARSIFVSFSHPDDEHRAPRGQTIVSISTHIPNPSPGTDLPVEDIAEQILNELDAHGLIPRERIVYRHFSTARTWFQWTRRQHGFVGGHPQFRAIKPWRMLDARLAPGLYQCGDTAYPGQGIPGACLSGITAHYKLMRDQSKPVRMAASL